MSTAKSAKCKICGKKYVSKQALIDHIDKAHSANIPEGWNVARYENFLRTGKTEGHCVYCKTETGWNDATGKYNRMCGSEKCKKIAREKASKNYIGLHGKPYSINNPEQQKKMVYGRKNSGKYIFEGEDGKEYVAMYDSSYGRDFFEMIDTLLSWDGADIIAPSPHTYWYEYEGKKHFYIPDAYSTSLNLEIEIKDGGDNPNNHPKIQAVDKIKEQKKDEVMKSLKGQVNYIKICNKDYTGFFAMLSELRQKDSCPLPKWESRLESITEAYLSDEADRGACFSWYHLEEEKKKYPGGWDDEQYFEDLNSAIRQVLSSVSLKERKGEVLRYVYTLGKDCGAVLLGAIVIKWYDYWDHVSPRYDFYWDYQEEVNLDDIDQERNPVQESAGVKKAGPGMILSEGFLRRQYKLRHPMLNYDNLMDYYRKKLFHENLDVAKWQNLYAELINVREYLKKVVNGNSEEDKRLNYEAKKALKQVESFIKYMEEKNAMMESVTESTANYHKLYHLSENNLDRSTLIPRVPHNFLVDSGYEDNKTKRVCFTESIDNSLRAMSSRLVGKKFYVHVPFSVGEIDLYHPTIKEVPDCEITGEVWVMRPIKVKCIGLIEVTADKGEKGIPYKYGNNTAELFDWEWKWVEHYEHISESKDIFEEGDFSEYREYADLDSARGPITESLLKTPKTLLDYSRIAKLINDKTVKDKKEPVGNQNCQLCTWCFEARIRGINVLPRPVYSPRDIIFSHNGYDIVKNPIQIKIKDKNDVVDNLLKSGDGSRYYVHVNWKGSSSGHEFLLANIDGKIYVLDGQAGLVSDINSTKGSAYFRNANFTNSFIVRLDDKDFNEGLLKLNDNSYIVDWDDDDAKLLDIAESTSIEATKDDTPYYPVFIFLSYTGTNMAKIIKAFTHDPYAHSSLSFDTDLNHMISFNRDGMVDESIFSGIYKKNAANIRYSLYTYMATTDEYEAMKNFVGELLGKRGKLKYNLLGLTNFIFGRGSEREDKFFCSEFVASVISAGNSKVFQRKPYMTSPYMLAKNKNFVFIKTGILKNYDSKVIDKIVAEKLEEGGFTNVIIK